MAMPKVVPNYAASLDSLKKGFNYDCTGCKETYTVYPSTDGKPFVYKCWCGNERHFTGAGQ